jgi:hypothetical protein
MRFALLFGAGVAVLVIAWAIWLWDNGKVRVHSDAQAAELAAAAAGPHVANLPRRIERDQDSWVVRFGPDEKGQMHDYMVTVWDRRARPFTSDTVDLAIHPPE